MKTRPFVISLLLAAQFANADPSNQGGHGIEFLPAGLKAPVGMAADDAELTAQRSRMKFGGTAPEDNAHHGWDLLEYSDFIGFDGFYAVLPKDSVILVPDSLRNHILQAPEGKMVGWTEMLTRYRAEVEGLEVTMEQATGVAPIAPERLEAAAKSHRIIVAVFQGNPVSVLRPAQGAVPTSK